MKTHVSKLMQNIVKQSQSCARILLSWQKKLTQNITVNGKRPKFEVAINTRRHSYWHLIVTRQTAWTKYDATDCSSMWHVYTSVENEAKQHHTTTHTITTRINPKFNKLCNKCIILWNSYKTNHNQQYKTQQLCSVHSCRVLPPGEYNGTILRPLHVYCETFVMTAVNIF